ncbi:MAG TPA: polysaccharide biosynthesis/export family protein [Longimicrobiales bacterium]|nr:polysaccharide biosynthesis/export family protein [Longimicrobiales bacterium]
MKKLALPLVFGALLAPATVSAQMPAPAAPAPLLQPGDAVRVTVWRRPELSGEFDLAADGAPRHPLYRDVRIAGVPADTVEARVRQFLSRYEENPRFVVEPLLRVAVGGEVRQPSLYAFAPEVTVANAIARAGGATERGRLDRVRVLRGGRELRVDLTRSDGGLGSERVRSGDQIVVGRRRDVFREVIGPTASLAGAAAAIANILLR